MTPMTRIAGGSFTMGSDTHYPEEAPAHRRVVGPFSISTRPVTVAEFANFASATGYRTTAEIAPARANFPDASEEQLVPGSLVFTPTDGPVPLDDPARWWAWVPGASWRHPEGPGSDVEERQDHPVVHVSFYDALAYAAWAGLALPSEPEWELAARGGLHSAAYAWGDELMPGGRLMANTWHGTFPHENRAPDGYLRTSPVGTFPPNGFGLSDMCGNVWEWTTDAYTPNHRGRTAEAVFAPASCCGSTGGPGRRYLVVKGGSHLCAPSYCRRYRPAARQPQTPDTSSSHLGFRCVARTKEDHQ